MDKRYQVFISSTFVDLKEERQALLRAVLELDQMPAGMELFPAADESAWDLIKDVIDASDYYVVVIGGRYGSQDEAGIGYTEKEYDYAIQARKSVIALLHENPDNLPRDKTDTDDSTWKKLQAFRAKIEKRHTCVYWRSPEDLKAKAIVGLTSAFKRHPMTGWIRADRVPTGATIADVLALRNRVAELEAQAADARVTPPVGTEDLQQGEDTVEIHVAFKARPVGASWTDDQAYTGSIEPAWNEIFAAIAPTMINEASESDVREAFDALFERRARGEFARDKKLKNTRMHEFTFRDEDVETCLVQFRALELIRESIRPRSVKDTTTYWTLTPYGDHLMTQLRALRRKPLEGSVPTSGAPEVTPSDGSGVSS